MEYGDFIIQKLRKKLKQNSWLNERMNLKIRLSQRHQMRLVQTKTILILVVQKLATQLKLKHLNSWCLLIKILTEIF